MIKFGMMKKSKVRKYARGLGIKNDSNFASIGNANYPL
jgi:hypothetical protein